MYKSFFFCRIVGTAGRQIVVGHNLCPDKSTLKIRVDLSCRLRRFCSSGDRPCAYLRLSGSQIADQSEKAVACLDQLLKPRLCKSQFLQEQLPFIVLKLCDLLLDLGAYYKNLTLLRLGILPHSLYPCIGSAVICKLILRNICRKDHRLVSEKIIRSQKRQFVLILRLKHLSKLPFLQMRLEPF